MLLIPAYAKVNLCLAVRGRRDDGFHELDSVVVTVDWHDLVGVRARPAPRTAVTLRVAGAQDLPAADGNLAYLAAAAVAAAAGPLDVDLWLDKRVPSAAGLGGGSADAAAVLRACASLARNHASGIDGAALAGEALLRLAATLGSDVPVLVLGGTQRMRGRGDVLVALPAPALHMAIAVVAASSTAATYAALVRDEFEDSARADAAVHALAHGRRPDDAALGSGLEPAACRAHPVLAERLGELRAAVPRAPWHLTGSGGAAFALAASAADAQRLAASASGAGFPARACRSVSG